MYLMQFPDNLIFPCSIFNVTFDYPRYKSAFVVWFFHEHWVPFKSSSYNSRSTASSMFYWASMSQMHIHEHIPVLSETTSLSIPLLTVHTIHFSVRGMRYEQELSSLGLKKDFFINIWVHKNSCRSKHFENLFWCKVYENEVSIRYRHRVMKQNVTIFK